MIDSARWVRDEFASLSLGHRWRNERWSRMALAAAARPSGRITECFSDPAERQAAYKLLESGAVRPCEVVRSAARAALRRATGRYVVVPVDQCTLSLSAATTTKGFGRLSVSEKKFGAESMHAIGLDADGVPLGLLAQQLWARTGPRRSRHRPTTSLPLQCKESRYWVQVAEDAHQAWRDAGLEAPLWFQLDAGGDGRQVLERLFALEDAYVTVRCRRDRRVSWPEDDFLSGALQRVTPVGRIQVRVQDPRRRQVRVATLEVRATTVGLRLKNKLTKKVSELRCQVVATREVGTCPKGEEPIEWVLLTTWPASSFESACEVVRAYALRWRIEEVHRTWKTGGKVESSGLSFASFQSWAALLLCVAVRAERLKRSSREQPDLPASGEFSPDELRALTLVSRRAKRRGDPAAPPSLAEAVLWVAELGGYMGPTPSRGPPGSIVIARGLDRLAHYTEAVRLLRDAKE